MVAEGTCEAGLSGTRVADDEEGSGPVDVFTPLVKIEEILLVSEKSRVRLG